MCVFYLIYWIFWLFPVVVFSSSCWDKWHTPLIWLVEAQRLAQTQHQIAFTQWTSSYYISYYQTQTKTKENEKQ